MWLHCNETLGKLRNSIMQPVIHLVYVDPIQDAWRVSGETRNQLFGTFKTKEKAIVSGRRIAKKESGQMIVRNANGGVEFAEDYASVER